ncbi:unnamed protein product [Nezara viridula]|uniref:Uncharacterized protein n=1 Tax=Nezara viridula TaxID=85310 RepID=A0A9P0H8X5_NEZVI|nr:unnamed protein product [Nezara viridula]
MKSKEPEPPAKQENSTHNDEEKESKKPVHLDIMAQQLKFVACLKILMEELSTLATGYEVDGGQLRYQLYLWLEREVEALRQLCNYSPASDFPESQYDIVEAIQDVRGCDTPTLSKEKPTLHEILMAEKCDFEAKVQRAARRKRWLKANETLLRTLLSYCSLHGASGGGLASVRMELVLLLQELQQEKTQQQLLSPLPFPTTLPLLSASVACNKTVIADPVRHLQSLAHDMLQTIIEQRNAPTLNSVNFSEVFVLRDLAVALSACIYQSLCDSDTCSVKVAVDSLHGSALDTLSYVNSSSHLIATQQRKRRYSTDEPLQVTTQPSKWPGVTNLRALLAREKDEDTPRLNILLTEAFVATFMSLTVYALATCDCHILYRLVGQKFCDRTWGTLYGGGVKKLLRVAQTSGGGVNSINRGSDEGSTESVWNTMTSLTKQRIRMNMKLLGQFGSQPGTQNIKEDKPTYREQFLPPEMSMISYFLSKPILSEDAQLLDYDSGGSERSDSESEGEDVFDGDKCDTHSMTDPRKENTEHSNPNSYSWAVMRLAIIRVIRGHPRHWSAAPARRLWSYLVRQEPVTELFVKCVFGKRPHSRSGESRSDDGVVPHHPPPHAVPEPIRLIHKDQDQISAGELENAQSASGFLVIQTPLDKMQASPNPSSSSPQPGIAVQSGRGASMVK